MWPEGLAGPLRHSPAPWGPACALRRAGVCPSGGPACPSGGPASAASGADAHAKCSSGRVLSSRRPLRACRTRCLGAAGGAGPRAAAQAARRAAAFTRAERGKYRARGPFWTQFTLEGFHAGRSFGLCGFWSSNSTSSAGHQWDDSLLQNRVFPVRDHSGSSLGAQNPKFFDFESSLVPENP